MKTLRVRRRKRVFRRKKSAFRRPIRRIRKFKKSSWDGPYKAKCEITGDIIAGAAGVDLIVVNWGTALGALPASVIRP